ncbi:MAG: hydantoinase/oxoprolinase family protein [Alphaproteobacteria bacterium]|nr:hydantoinase/oxoprolinase family protein [Alphaproteobacteria bacterium]
MYYLGVDTGGTFTDFVALNAKTGELITFKVPSVPSDPAQAVRNGVVRLKERHGVDPRQIARFIYGTTVATNAILESKGARTALVATKGTRDVLEIQRMWRSRLFDLNLQKPKPLVPRRDRHEVDERMDARGRPIVPLTDAEAERVAEWVAEGDYEAVAVSCLFSFLAPEHEQRIKKAIEARAPGLPVCISSNISPEFREYERTATTAMNAYVMPKIHQMAKRLEELLGELGCDSGLRIIQSNGGLMNTETTRRFPVNTLLSGPAGGVVGAAGVAKAAGIDKIIAMDMGGTSLDISLVEDGQVTLSSEGQLAGFPVKVPQVNVHTIGAGGGSLARVVLGALKVGPESAGAVPGPVCYRRGGTEPASTDAAWAIVQVQVANMVTGIREVSVAKGHDPREFALLPFGGAGCLYAGLIAEDLKMRRIFVPVEPSVLSAFGMLLTDVKYARSLTRLVEPSEKTAKAIAAVFDGLEKDLNAALKKEGFKPAEIRVERSCDMRYKGQAYELNVKLPPGKMTPKLAGSLAARFHKRHHDAYGQSSPDEAVEIVNFRATGMGLVKKAQIKPLKAAKKTPAKAKGERKCYFGGKAGWKRCKVYERSGLQPGVKLAGPFIVEEPGATIVGFPGHTLTMDKFGNLLIAVLARRAN